MLLPCTARALDRHLATAQVTHRLPSLAGAAVRDGDSVWSRAIETTADTQFRIGSLTKTFVAVLVMRLRDEGRLTLSDRFGDHVPDTPLGDVTVAQLLSHTAGIASETPGPWWERSPGELRPTLSDALGDAPFKHPPGRRFHYSNPGFTALGVLVEQLRGEPWTQTVQREILAPLEMSRTSVLPRAPYAEGLAVHPWADVVMPEVVQDVGRMAPAGQLWSTIGDLCQFATLLSGGAPEVLAADTAAEMRTPHATPEVATWQSSYGLGVQLLQSSGRMLAGHTGSMPGYLCALWVSPDDDAGAIVLTNTTSGVNIGGLAAELVGILADREPRIPAPWRPAADARPEDVELTGPWYWGPAGFALRLIAKGELMLGPVAGGPGRSTRFAPAGDGTWTGQNGYFAGETLRPVRDLRGRLGHLDIASFVFTREPYDPGAPIPGGVDAGGWRTAR